MPEVFGVCPGGLPAHGLPPDFNVAVTSIMPLIINFSAVLCAQACFYCSSGMIFRKNKGYGPYKQVK